MSSQKSGKTKQKSLLSWVKPQARVKDENVEESCAAEIPEGGLNNYMELMELWEWSLDICREII